MLFSLLSSADDVASSVMGTKIRIEDYFKYPETNRPMELVYGYVREPPSPFGDHQTAVLRIGSRIDDHVRDHDLGRVFIAPFDVVLDHDQALVVQPDVLFIAKQRLSIIRGPVWGAPDLVVEVASPNTRHRDRTLKLQWYRRYGVKECWLADTSERQIEVVDCATDARTVFTGEYAIQSRVLTKLSLKVEECFG
jgi:Uma2 family endonuclease